MTSVELKKSLHNGGPVFGALIVSPSPFWPKVLGDCGLDFVFIDTEHIALDRSQVSWMCRTYAAMGLPPLVRTVSPSPYEATMVLDDGAAGVVAPYIEQAEQVQQLRGATKLRPLKGQRLNDALAGEPLPGDLANYAPGLNENNLLIVNIESVPAVENLDRILDVPGIDSVLIGPHDLSCNLGKPEPRASAPAFTRGATPPARRASSTWVPTCSSTKPTSLFSKMASATNWRKSVRNLVCSQATPRPAK